MVCLKCGKEMEDGMHFCPSCGTSVDVEPQEAKQAGIVLSGDLVKLKEKNEHRKIIALIVKGVALLGSAIWLYAGVQSMLSLAGSISEGSEGALALVRDTGLWGLGYCFFAYFFHAFIIWRIQSSHDVYIDALLEPIKVYDKMALFGAVKQLSCKAVRQVYLDEDGDVCVDGRYCRHIFLIEDGLLSLESARKKYKALLEQETIAACLLKHLLPGAPVNAYENGKKNARFSRFGLALGICAVVMACMWMPFSVAPDLAESRYVRAVKNGCPQGYPGISYGEALENFFDDSKWSFFKSTEGQNVVEFHGSIYQNEEGWKEVDLQFLVSDNGAIEVGAMEVDGEAQIELVKGLILVAFFENYNWTLDKTGADLQDSWAALEEEMAALGDSLSPNQDEAGDLPDWGEAGDQSAEPETVNQPGEDISEDDYPYGLDYEVLTGDYSRLNGPKCGISIWEMNENGITFAVGLGTSGYLAYVDMRDCTAEWIDEYTAVYTEDYSGYRLEFAFQNEEAYVTLTENQPYSEEFSLAGGYMLDSTLQDNSHEYVFPDDNVAALQPSDLWGKTAGECKIARNEIYARYGRRFNDEQLQGYFDTCSWYSGTVAAEDFSDNVLNEVEKANLQVIAAYESEMGYR